MFAFFMYRNLISFFIPNLYILCCVSVAAGEVCVMLIFVKLGVMLYFRHSLLKYILAQHSKIFRLTFLYW